MQPIDELEATESRPPAIVRYPVATLLRRVATILPQQATDLECHPAAIDTDA